MSAGSAVNGATSGFYALRNAIDYEDNSNLNSFESTVWNYKGSKTDGTLSFQFTDNTGVVTNTGATSAYVYIKFYQKGDNSGRIKVESVFDSASYSHNNLSTFYVRAAKTYTNNYNSNERTWEVILEISPAIKVTVLFEGHNYNSYLKQFKWIKQTA